VSRSPVAPLGISDTDYFLRLISGAMSEALDSSYTLVVTPPGLIGAVLDRAHPEGAIVVDPLRNDPALTQLETHGIAVVTTGRHPGGETLHWVDNDHREGVTAMLDHLLQPGGRCVAVITGPRVNSYTVDALAAYRQWAKRHKQRPLIATTRGALTEGAGYEAATRLLHASPRPDAIYATLDRLALGALLAIRSEGLRVPEDILLAAGSDSDAARSADPPLTTLDLNPEAIGRAAVRSLIDLLDRPQSDGTIQIVLPTRINERRSTKHRVSANHASASGRAKAPVVPRVRGAEQTNKNS
jgi:DNA-binding LacI/PurR family transcriptional regulator